MNKTKKIAVLGIVAVLFAVLTVSSASAHVFMKYQPLESNVPEGECHSAYVELWVNVSGDDDLKFGQYSVHYDPSCVNITDHEFGMWVDPALTSWNTNPVCYGPGYTWSIFQFAFPVGHPMVGDEALLVNITVHCESNCTSDILIDDGENPSQCILKLRNSSGKPVSGYTLVNNTFQCGEPPAGEEYSANLVVDWNSISLPLIGTDIYTDMTVDSVINTTLENKYDALVRYNATSDEFEDLSGSDEMDNGVGYFIHMKEAGTWSYWGLPYESMTVQLKSGLNLIGWVNETGTAIDTAVASIADDYNYDAKFNATAGAQNYGVYEPGAPDGFNDFATMDRGNGYWIAAKNDCVLTYP